MRAYFLTNMYLSSIQNGIQPLHCVAEMFLKYSNSKVYDTERKMLYDWAAAHKTVIVLNGGDSEAMIKAYDTIYMSGFPFASFDEPGLGHVTTCVGVIVPEEVYNPPILEENPFIVSLFGGGIRAIEVKPKPDLSTFSKEEIELRDLLTSLPLAR